MMSDMDWKRMRVKNRQAKEEASNVGLLLFLVVIGGFLFAGNTVMSQIGRMTNSLRRNIARTASEKESPIKTLGKTMNKNSELTSKVCEVTLDNDDRNNG